MGHCECCHEHKEHHEHGRKLHLALFLARLIVAGGITIAFMFVHAPFWVELPACLAAFLLAGYTVIWDGLKSIARGRFFGEGFMMSIVGVAAFAIGQFHESVAIMLFFGVGELLQDFAVERSKRNIAKLMDIRPDFANVKRNGQILRLAPTDVAIGDIIVVRPGEKIPLDGIVTAGNSFLDTKAITGEPVPRTTNVGDNVLSGTINTQSPLEIRVTKPYGESTVAKILDLVQNAQTKKSKSEKFITKFARVFTPAIMLIALAVALVPPLAGFGTFPEWIYRAVCFVAISCPCALVMSIPLGVFAGIGGSARNGILIKGGNYLETLADVRVIAFDKTGTLTKGVFVVTEIHPTGLTSAQLLELTAIAEQHSPHPIAKSIIEYFASPITQTAETREITGQGIIAQIGTRTVHVGNQKLMATINITGLPTYPQTTVYVAINEKYAGCILIADVIKPNAPAAIADLARVGIGRTIMLTGDNETTARTVAQSLGITEYRANLLPQDKVTTLEEIKSHSPHKIAFVGDGMNDAPVLSRADIGIAMGGIASDATIETADIVIMNDDLGKIAVAKRIARKTKRVIIQNIALALGVKGAVMLLAFFGMAKIWLAIFADVGVALLAILNSTRCLGKH